VVKRGGLGRGLDALLGTAGAGESAPAHDEPHLGTLSIDQLRRGRFQPRVDMRQDTLQELADSISAQGLVQPILVRPLASGEFEIVAGERRWRAAQIAGLVQVPVLVQQVSDREAMAVALVENIQREDLNPLEEATAIRRLVAELELTHQQVAEAIGRSRVAVSNLLRLLDLTEPVQVMLRERRLEMGHARALLGLEPGKQAQVAQQVERNRLSVRETEQLVRRLLAGEQTKSVYATTLDPDVRGLQDRLSARLGTRVTLQHSKSGKGKLVIHYGNVDELDGILEHLQ